MSGRGTGKSGDGASRSAETDVLVVGGGLVGASLAVALAPLGLSITVIENSPVRDPSPPSYDDRTLALGAASCRILEGIGLWPSLAADATPIREVTVTELQRPGRVVLDAASMGLDRFGNVVEARAFGQAVLDHLRGLSRVAYRQPCRATGIEARDDEVRVRVEGEEETVTWRARLVVGADGAASDVRDLLGIGAERHDYGQVALICNVTPERAHRNRAFERMTPTGPFALLPHVGTRCGLVWCAPADDGEALRALDDDAFLAAATERSGGVLGRLERCGRRSVYPLRRVVPESDRRGRVLLLGNAAHAIHPVGAQGFNLGLRDVAVLAELIADARAEQGGALDPGGDPILSAYTRWRRPDREATIGWSHDMVRLFASRSPVTRAARSVALAAVGVSPALQRRLASRAMGYRGRSPRLALGEPLLRDWGVAS
jgi:2-octaprenyl-6-methoxyphenol hydroxylase